MNGQDSSVVLTGMRARSMSALVGTCRECLCQTRQLALSYFLVRDLLWGRSSWNERARESSNVSDVQQGYVQSLNDITISPDSPRAAGDKYPGGSAAKETRCVQSCASSSTLLGSGNVITSPPSAVTNRFLQRKPDYRCSKMQPHQLKKRIPATVVPILERMRLLCRSYKKRQHLRLSIPHLRTCRCASTPHKR